MLAAFQQPDGPWPVVGWSGSPKLSEHLPTGRSPRRTIQASGVGGGGGGGGGAGALAPPIF